VTLLLFLGLLVMIVLHHQLSLRVNALEAELREWHGEEPPEPAVAQELPRERSSETTSPPRASAATWLGEAPAARPSEAPEEAQPEPAPATLSGLFENLVGGHLLIWVGGIALAVAGIFLIRYSIEIGLITPPVRMILAALFGFLLLGAGELARSRPDGLIDPRAGQALVGAGILVLYATPYGSLVLYGLLSMGTASLLMVMVTAVALVLSLRHGAPAAALGLVGGFATPLLVGERTETLVPLLSYLALLNIALFVIAGRRGWTWLAAASVALSFAWSGALLFEPRDDAIAAGVFILAVALGGSLARAGEDWHLDFLRPAAIGLVELAVLVGRDDIGLPAWLLFGALSLACFFLAPRKSEYRRLPALALTLALILLAVKAATGPDPLLPWIAAAITLLFAGGSLPALLRGRARASATALAAAAFVGPVLILRLARPELLDPSLWGALLLAVALGPLLLAWLRRSESEPGQADLPRFVAAAAAALLAGVALWDLLPDELVGSAWLLLVLASAFAARRLDDSGLTALAVIGLAVAAGWNLTMVDPLWIAALGSLLGEPALATGLPSSGRALQMLVVPLPLLVLLWRLLPDHYPRLRALPFALAGLFAVAAIYVLFKRAYGLSDGADFIARGFAERMLITQGLFLAGWLVCSNRVPLPRIEPEQRRLAGTILTALAAARLVWFDMLIHNPAFAEQWVGTWPVANLLAPAYLLSAFWLYKVRRGGDSKARRGLWLTTFLAATILGVMLMVRQLFQGPILAHPGISATESYGYSLAGLLLSMALLWAGIRLPDKALRIAGLALLTATTLKVFLSDASVLEGVLRILSFLVLGGFLIGIGKLYTKVLAAEARPKDEAAG
jgi:uncharacterized membrane protein